MRREDLSGRQAPQWAQQLLLRCYGRTPFDEPRYRLVWAPSRLEQSGGVWVDWDDSVAIEQRQSLDDSAPQPLRRVAQMRWTPKYPGLECWLIERWLPAASYGTPEQWYRPASEGGTVIALGADGATIAACGDYPFYGDYEDIGAHLFWYPSERHLTGAIDAVRRAHDSQPNTAWARALRRSFLAQEEQQRRDREYDHFCHDLLTDTDQAFGGAPLIGFGGTRRHSSVELCERIGIREHPF